MKLLVIAFQIMWSAVICSAQSPKELVFLRSNDVYRAAADGSHIHRLTFDGNPKQWPKWSPGGKRIAYLLLREVHTNPKSSAAIEIISRDGERLYSAPVLTTLSNGTPVVGMRGVESIGWYDYYHVFAAGSANPYVIEYRIIDIRDGASSGYIGGGFASCPAKGRVAFWSPVFPTHRNMDLEVNGRRLGFGFPDAIDGIPSIHVDLHWGPDCESVAFVDARSPAALVVADVNGGEKRITLPAGGPLQIDDTTLSGRGLIVTGTKTTLLYNFGDSISLAPKELLDRIRVLQDDRQRVVQKLDATDPDWFD